MYETTHLKAFINTILNAKIEVIENGYEYQFYIKSSCDFHKLKDCINEHYSNFIDEVHNNLEQEIEVSYYLKNIKHKLEHVRSQIKHYRSLSITKKGQEKTTKEDLLPLKIVDVINHNYYLISLLEKSINLVEEIWNETFPNQNTALSNKVNLKKYESEVKRLSDELKNITCIRAKIEHLKNSKQFFIDELQKDGVDFYESPFYTFYQFEIEQLKDLIISNSIKEEHADSYPLHWNRTKRDFLELVAALSRAGVLVDKNNNEIPRTEIILHMSKFLHVEPIKNSSSSLVKILDRENPTAFLDHLKEVLKHHTY
jgi:hypothetical protein